mmetsp:Transcript_2742/g.7639  ORF Transcript_2742/g.7639 Transcript_2742/m.7639 type:complete len:113 (-) Transcript_2742:52-390(-)
MLTTIFRNSIWRKQQQKQEQQQKEQKRQQRHDHSAVQIGVTNATCKAISNRNENEDNEFCIARIVASIAIHVKHHPFEEERFPFDCGCVALCYVHMFQPHNKFSHSSHFYNK